MLSFRSNSSDLMHATNCRIFVYLDIVGVRSDAGLVDLEPVLEAPGIEQAHRDVVADHLAHLNSRWHNNFLC
jgi:hypothetical protein